MNAEQRAALHKVAEEATPGPWERDLRGYLVKARNRKYITAANPSTILQLLDYIDTLEKDAARHLWCKLHPERAASIFEHLGPAYFDSEIDAAMQGGTK